MDFESRTVVLSSGQTKVDISAETQEKAIASAFLATCSPHEHDWSIDEQLAMAQFCLWAHQRLCAIADCLKDDLEQEDV